MKKIILTLAFILAFSCTSFGSSRNMIKESGSVKTAGTPVNAKLLIEPNDEVILKYSLKMLLFFQPMLLMARGFLVPLATIAEVINI